MKDISTPTPKKSQPRKKKKWLYLTFFIIIALLIIGLYFRFGPGISKFYHQHFSKNEEIESFPSLDNSSSAEGTNPNATKGSAESNPLSYLTQLKDWQQNIDNKLTGLLKNNKTGSDVDSKTLYNIENELKSLTLDKDTVKNSRILISFLAAITTGNTFGNELEAFKTTKIAKEYQGDISFLSSVAPFGVPTYFELSHNLIEIEPVIIKEYYSLATDRWSKFKYYLTRFITIRKQGNFSSSEFNTISYQLYLLQEYINHNQLPKAVQVITSDSKLQHLASLKGFTSDLNNRVKLDSFYSKFQQYLLNIH